jgi:hypothetical protein
VLCSGEDLISYTVVVVIVVVVAAVIVYYEVYARTQTGVDHDPVNFADRIEMFPTTATSHTYNPTSPTLTQLHYWSFIDLVLTHNFNLPKFSHLTYAVAALKLPPGESTHK